MPYDKPTVDQFIARFPIFNDDDPAIISALIDEATNTIDTDWVETDYQPAIMYLTAHLIATDNSEEGEDVEFGSPGGGGIVSESFNGMSVSYSQKVLPESELSNLYASTEYGRRYLALLRRNKPAIVAI